MSFLIFSVYHLLQDLLKALKGLVVMSEQLEMMSNSLFINQVPDIWAGKVGHYFFSNIFLPGFIISYILTLYLNRNQDRMTLVWTLFFWLKLWHSEVVLTL